MSNFSSQEDNDWVWRAIAALWTSPDENDQLIATNLSRIMARTVSLVYPSEAECVVLELKAKRLGMNLGIK